jgi:glycosyltransferase involved in cell wall biosynthesis
MKIAILGIRGIPANYGGFETFAEELSTRLVRRGHDVTVYGRSNNIRHPEANYRGVRLAVLPTIPTKHLDTVAHTFLSVLHVLGQRFRGRSFDAILMCNAVNAIFCLLPRAVGIPVALNVDGIERLRKKWGPSARAVYRLSETLATRIPSVVVTDAGVIEQYFRQQHGTVTEMIAYGADTTRTESTATLDRLGLEPRRYFLYVSRLEPENNAHLAIEAYNAAQLDGYPLVVVGDAPYASEYIARLRALASPGVLLPGAIYGEGYRELRSHAYAWIQATEVGGTHPALLEAMGAGNCVLAKDTPEHREVLDDTGLYFDRVEDLAALMRGVVDDESGVRRMRAAARSRVEALYSWDAVTEQYEALFRRMTRQ